MTSGDSDPRPAGPSSSRFRVSAVIAVAAAVVIGAWLLTRGSGHSAATGPTPATTTAGHAARQGTATTTTAASVTPVGPASVSAGGLKELSRALHEQIYWVGPRSGYTYEVTVNTKGYVYVRYLPPGVKVGDPHSGYLIVSTYPFPNALAALKGVAHGGGQAVAGGGFALPSAGYPESYHLAFPSAAYEVEVYDPVPAVARQVALSGRVRAVG
jgi:hypothetical protein